MLFIQGIEGLGHIQAVQPDLIGIDGLVPEVPLERAGLALQLPMHKRGGWAYRADNDPETWETVWIGIDKGTVPEHFRKIISIAVQFQMMPAEHSGLAFRNFRLEEAE